MKFAGLFFLFCFALFPQDLQNRTVVKTPLDFGDRWYMTFWSITNLKTQTSNNTNLFPGIGYQSKTWWAEAMLQKQWSSTGGLWSADFRFRKQLNHRLSVYIEPAVLFPSLGLYEFVVFESRVAKGFSFGAETENVHRLSKQSLAAGPRVGYALGKRWGWEFATAFAYRFVPTGSRDEARLYFVVTRRIRLRP
ncbi:MAG: hypothetical protein M1333_01545 [Patescibacteria group bacterium]|nr:hypothetical protein [Patescibacteria group bacterium]